MSKSVLFDIDMDDEDSDKEQEVDINAYSSVRIEDKLKSRKDYQSKTIQKNMLQAADEDDYHNAIIIPTNSTVKKKVLNKKEQSKNIELEVVKRQKQRQKNQQLTIFSSRRSIKILGEFEYESSSEEDKGQQKKNYQYEQQTKQNKADMSPSRASIANINLQDSDQSDRESQRSTDSHQKQIKRVLSLKPSQLQKITMKQIAISNDPLENMKVLVNKQVNMHKILNMKIVRNKSGFTSIWPQFKIFLTQNGAKVLYAKKMMGSTTANYYMTLSQEIDDVNHPFFIAKMRANFWNNVYTVYSKGSNPKKSEGNSKKRSVEATIVFLPQKQARQPRQFEVYTLANNVEYRELQGYKQNQQIGLDQLYLHFLNKGKIFKFKNRKPVYSTAVEGYILNFGGRVNMASIKNFILEDVIAHREAMMFGKLENDIFRIDVSWPLKPFIALGICLANMDSTYTSQ